MNNRDVTTIQLDRAVIKALKRIKRYPRETYNDIILDLIKNRKEIEDLDEFLNKAQQAKMKELWGEGDYKAWEHA